MALKKDQTQSSARPDYLAAHACFDCRKSFKRKPDIRQLVKLCPDCGGPAVNLGRKFKPPAKDKVSEWEVVRFLYESGFPFHSVGEPYPRTMSEAKDFVQRYEASKIKSVKVPVWTDHPVRKGKRQLRYISCSWTPYENPVLPDGDPT